MAITRLGIASPSANSDTLIYTSDKGAVVSIIASNKSSTAASVRAWTVPAGATLPAQYAYHAYDTPLPGNNTLETFRFAIKNGDTIYVRASTGDVSFSLNGIYETNGTANISVSATEPTAAAVGDVWVDTNTDEVKFYDGAVWVVSVASPAPTTFYQASAPSTPSTGYMWVDSDDNVFYVYNGSTWIQPAGGGGAAKSTIMFLGGM